MLSSTLMSAIFAVSAAFVWAVSLILIRKGIEHSNFFAVTLVTTILGIAVFLPTTILLFYGRQLDIYAALVFVSAGILHPALFRIFFFKGIEKVGVSVNSSIFAMYPVFSVLWAFFLIGEQPTIWILVGIGCIVIGAVVIQRGINSGDERGLPWKKLLFPVSAALINGLAYVVKKIGLNMYNEPFLGSTLTYVSALTVFGVIMAFSPKFRDYGSLDRKSFVVFWKGGLGMCIGSLLSFYALQYQDVTIVTPLLQTEPFFVLLLTFLFLRGMESLSSKLIAGAICMVSGVMLILLL